MTNTESMIFRDLDYFAILLQNYEDLPLDKLDYFSLKQLTIFLLNELGYIPLSEGEDPEWMFCFSLIEHYLKNVIY